MQRTHISYRIDWPDPLLRNLGFKANTTLAAKKTTPKITHFGRYGGTENGTWDARFKILRPILNTNTPPPSPENPHLDTLGTILDPRKMIFGHFVLFGEFWSFSRVGGIFFGKVYDFQPQFHLGKRNSFFNVRVPSESYLRVDFK